MYPYPKTASMVTMVAMVGNSVGKSAKKSVAKFWSTSWSLQTLLVSNHNHFKLSCSWLTSGYFLTSVPMSSASQSLSSCLSSPDSCEMASNGESKSATSPATRWKNRFTEEPLHLPPVTKMYVMNSQLSSP